MKIVGCDFHPGWQQIAVFDDATAELEERKLSHGNGEAEKFYRALPAPSLIGVEACGNSQWFLELLQHNSAAVKKRRETKWELAVVS